ncbi:glutathione S-transferase family protein [Humitalea sp. 24SJ18S-53]|uniref:glutathione S-transferase family protein n=1 Tax=Humitalea sp. 24SJ18S-53 TaxID=3422307 RepID=UPI003D6678F7
MTIATLWTSTRTNGTVAHMVAAASALPIEYRFISLRGGDHKTPGYLALNPKGEVPALDVGGGVVVTENPAICTWIADMAPGAGLLPTSHPQRAKALEWMAWCQFTTARAFFLALGARRIAGDDAAAAAVIKADGLRRSQAALALADAAIQPDGTLLGTGQVMVPDIHLFMLTTFAGFASIDITQMAGLQRLRATVGANPGVQAALARETAIG